LIGGQPACSHETSGVQFYTRAGLAGLPLSESRTTFAQLQRMFAHAENPDWPADLD